MSTLSGPTLQPGTFRSGVLGDPSYNDGSLGHAQPHAIRSGSLGFPSQPTAFRSGSLGMAQPDAYNSGSLGCGGGCSRPTAGLGTTLRYLGQGRRGIRGLGALGALPITLDFAVGAGLVFAALYFVDKKKA